MKKRRFNAFTLLELLIVIAVIAVLLALGATTLSAAKDKARMANCLNNLRQLGFGIAMYTGDYKEYPPDITTNASGTLVRNFGAIGGHDGVSTNMGPAYVHIPPSNERPLQNYVNPGDVFRCTEDSGTAIDGDRPITNFRLLGCSYWYNFWVPSLQSSGTLSRKSPNLLILLFEPPATPIAGRSGRPWYFQWHYRNGGKGASAINDMRLDSVKPRFISPILFLDGHVAVKDFTAPLVTRTENSVQTEWIWK